MSDPVQDLEENLARAERLTADFHAGQAERDAMRAQESTWVAPWYQRWTRQVRELQIKVDQRPLARARRRLRGFLVATRRHPLGLLYQAGNLLWLLAWVLVLVGWAVVTLLLLRWMVMFLMELSTAGAMLWGGP